MSKLRIQQTLLALAATAALAIVAAGCGTTTADVETGRELFRTKCGTCHALAQAGTSAEVGPNLDHAFAAARASGQSDETIEGVVEAQVEYPRPSNGASSISMPANIVEGQELDDVAAYVARWAGVPGAAPPRVPGGPGAQVFANNSCGSCHTFKAANSGGTTGPNLDESFAPDDDAASIEEMIVDPNAEIVPGYPPNVMPLTFGETISKKELEDLVDYLLENSQAGGGKSGKGKGKKG